MSSTKITVPTPLHQKIHRAAKKLKMVQPGDRWVMLHMMIDHCLEDPEFVEFTHPLA